MKSKGLILVVTIIAVAAILVSGGTVMAAGGWHGGGHGGGGHWSGGHGWHGGHGGGHWRSAWGWGGWPYYGLGLATGAFLSYPYYYQPYYPYYPYAPYANAPTYSPSPRVIVRERESAYADERVYSKPARARYSAGDFWYYCKRSNAYYPYVRRCAGGWEKVPVVPPAELPQPTANIIDKMTLRVNFDVDQAIIRSSDKAVLNKMVDFVKKYPGAKIELDGYTDNSGTAAHNRRLSEKRADAVKKYLIKEAVVDQSQISTVGRGESNPVADNKTYEGRFQNRRVEILILPD
jgi:outer membrane protein OmpA-like peptidoglycan-associated protein